MLPIFEFWTLSKMNQMQDASKPKSRETDKWLNVQALVENKQKLLQLWLTLYFALFFHYIETSQLLYRNQWTV